MCHCVLLPRALPEVSRVATAKSLYLMILLRILFSAQPHYFLESSLLLLVAVPCPMTLLSTIAMSSFFGSAVFERFSESYLKHWPILIPGWQQCVLGWPVYCMLPPFEGWWVPALMVGYARLFLHFGLALTTVNCFNILSCTWSLVTCLLMVNINWSKSHVGLSGALPDV